MLRVLIADDEERICQLILALGEWQRLGLTVAGTAQTGPDALEMVRTIQPDILITDIRMPGMDGLQVIQEAHALLPDLEVIVISGYAQFDYAQTAIHYGVGEYLLKPINRDALNHSLEKMIKRVNSRRRKETDIEYLLTGRMDDQQQLRAKLIADMLAGRMDADSADALKRAYHFYAEEDLYQLLLLKLDYDPAHFSLSSLSVVREKVKDIFMPILSSVCADSVLDFDDATMYGVMNLNHAKHEFLRAQLRTGMNQLTVEKGLFGTIAFSLALGTPCHTPKELAASLSKAANTLSERITEGTGRMLEGEACKSGLLEMDYQARYTFAASHAIDVLSVQDADEAVCILEEAASIPGARGWELFTLVRMAGLMFITRLSVDNSEGILTAFHKRCALCSSVSELFECLRNIQREQLQLAEQRLRDRDTQPIRNAKLYIRKNFAQPITLEEVSAAIGFSVNYFSTLFKKETGEGFAKYLTKVRMDEARAMLRDSNEPVSEICKNVGYSDLKHFTHTFKAETGLTPGEYRKLYG